MPERYGGSEPGISEAAVMMQTIAGSSAGMNGASSIHMNILGWSLWPSLGRTSRRRNG